MGVPVPFGPWEPDKGPFSGASIDTCVNLNPVANGWSSFPGLQEIGSSLGDQFRGCWRVRASDGSYSIIAGTATGLFKYNTSTSAWDDISGASAPYNLPDGHYWSAVQFGTLFIVVNLEDPPQVYDADAGGTFSDLGGSPPQAKFIAIAGDFVLLGYLKVGADEFPQDVHNSGLNDATYWTIDRKKGSDRQKLPDGNEIMGLFAFPGGARVIQRDAKRAYIFTGGQYIFETRVIDAMRGSIAPNSIVPISANDYVFWRSDGIYRGDDNVPIGAQRVDSFLFNQVDGDADLTELDTVQGIADPFGKVILWRYTRSSGGNRVIGWDWELDRWFLLDVDAEFLFSAVTPGTTLEALDAISASIDALTPSLDSRVWKGGAPTVGATTSANILAYFSGDVMSGTIETATTEFNQDVRSFVAGVKVKGNPGLSTTIRVGTAQLPDDALTWDSAVTRSSRTGLYPARADAYYHRFRLTTAEGDTGFSHLHGLTVDADGSGEA